MRSQPLSLKRVLLLSSLLALRVLAQDNENKEVPAPATRDEDAPAATNTQPTSAEPTNTEPTATQEDRPTVTEATSEPTTTADEEETSTEETSEPEPTATSAESSRTVPPLTTTASTTRSRLTGLPTLSKTVNTEVPDYPPPTVPPTHNAPFMKHSTLPDGTVFIAVGAILGALGAAVLAWRGIVACLLHRSVERAARAQHAANNGRAVRDKNAASFPAPPSQFYKYIERESSASLAAGGSTGRRTNRGPIPSATPSQTNLFFSPTAAGSSAAGGLGGSSNRESARYLPSGFYASAAPVPGGGGGGHGHGHGNSISMSTLRPSSRGRGAGQLGPSPPESPDVGPRVVSRDFSSSSLNLNRPPSPGARAPSAYLDDLLDDQPGHFPPAGGSPSGQGYGSQGRRY